MLSSAPPAGTGAKVRLGSSSGSTDDGCFGVALSGDPSGDAATFVWSDGQGADFTSTGDYQFLVRAAGGVAINTNTPAAGSALTVNGDTSTSGNVSFGSDTRQMLNLWGPDGRCLRGARSDLARRSLRAEGGQPARSRLRTICRRHLCQRL